MSGVAGRLHGRCAALGFIGSHSRPQGVALGCVISPFQGSQNRRRSRCRCRCRISRISNSDTPILRYSASVAEDSHPPIIVEKTMQPKSTECSSTQSGNAAFNPDPAAAGFQPEAASRTSPACAASMHPSGNRRTCTQSRSVALTSRCLRGVHPYRRPDYGHRRAAVRLRLCPCLFLCLFLCLYPCPAYVFSG